MQITPNTYFEGQVQSLGFTDKAGKATVGIMLPGHYTFNTAAPETMTVITGCLSVQLPSAEDFTDFNAGESFEVPGQSRFDLQVAEATAYLCRFH